MLTDILLITAFLISIFGLAYAVTCVWLNIYHDVRAHFITKQRVKAMAYNKSVFHK